MRHNVTKAQRRDRRGVTSWWSIPSFTPTTSFWPAGNDLAKLHPGPAKMTASNVTQRPHLVTRAIRVRPLELFDGTMNETLQFS